jgi:hypothetical protein
MDAITVAEAAEGRRPRSDFRAVDRAGNKYDVVTFVYPHGNDPANESENYRPSGEYLRQVVVGARHWELPTGWVVGLEELAEDA